MKRVIDPVFVKGSDALFQKIHTQIAGLTEQVELLQSLRDVQMTKATRRIFSTISSRLGSLKIAAKSAHNISRHLRKDRIDAVGCKPSPEALAERASSYDPDNDMIEAVWEPGADYYCSPSTDPAVCVDLLLAESDDRVVGVQIQSVRFQIREAFTADKYATTETDGGSVEA